MISSREKDCRHCEKNAGVTMKYLSFNMEHGSKEEESYCSACKRTQWWDDLIHLTHCCGIIRFELIFNSIKTAVYRSRRQTYPEIQNIHLVNFRNVNKVFAFPF